ncbi:MAG: hypothetical protein QM796_02075 [Chthoniobacteraceae bacterium]
MNRKDRSIRPRGVTKKAARPSLGRKVFQYLKLRHRLGWLWLLVMLLSLFTNRSLQADTASVVQAATAFEATLSTSQISTLQLSYTLANAEIWSNLPVGIASRNGLEFSSLSFHAADGRARGGQGGVEQHGLHALCGNSQCG